MYFANSLSFLLASATFYSQCAAARVEQEQAQALRAPILASREFTPIEEAGLERRATCPDGGQCFLGQCCGTGCSPNCCAHDDGGSKLHFQFFQVHFSPSGFLFRVYSSIEWLLVYVILMKIILMKSSSWL